MNGKVSQVTIVVKNQEAALDFYTKKVGWEIKTDFTPPGRPRWVTVGLKGQDLELALFQAVTRADPRDPSSAWSINWKPGTALPITIRVDDCRRAFDELKSRGVQFKETQPGEYPWGIVATFGDPDGNNFSIVQPPAYPSRV